MAIADGTSRFVWLVVIPVLLATIWMRYFVPTPAAAEGSWAAPLARVGDEHTIALFIALFFVFSAITRHFSFLLSDSRTATAKRAHPIAIVVTVGLAAAAALLLRGYVAPFRVLSASMLPTLEPEDVVLGRRTAGVFGDVQDIPARGDIVVFQKPADLEGDVPDALVKRVIGLPGDRITMKSGHPVINGWEVPSCDAGPYLYPLPTGGGVVGRLFVEFVDDRAYITIYATIGPEWEGPYDVKPGEVFVLGDNRNNSMDSRAWNKGAGAGLPASSIDAYVDRWLFGLRRDDRVDVGHLLHPLERYVRLDGLDSAALRDGIAHCLKQRPAKTTPPRPARTP